MAKWTGAAMLICYGVAVLAAGLLSYDIAYVFGAPRYSVAKLQQFSLALGSLSIGFGLVVLLNKRYRKAFTLMVAIAAPVTIIVFNHVNEINYNKKYLADDHVGQMQISFFTDSKYGMVNTGELRWLNNELLGHVKKKIKNARENIYSLPIKKRLEEGMSDAQKEIEYFKKKQAEANRGDVNKHTKGKTP
ncbi:MAG: hypothetical protein AAB408_04690 [Patescibacteria group bacterium]